MGGSEVIGLVVGIVLSVAIFFALREVVCWYFKINDMVEIQKRQLLLLTTLVESERLDGSAKSEFITTSLDSIEKL